MSSSEDYATTTFSNVITEIAGATQTVDVTAQVIAPTEKVSSGSVLDDSGHQNPIDNPSEPIVLFIVQVCFIIIICRCLGYFLQKIRQPRVISEVIGGIILGPSVLGQIPGFTENIFPPDSLPHLNVVATLGLILFLFIVGLETDLSVFRRNAKPSIAISVIGILIPFGLGCAVSIGLYNKFVDSDEVAFGHFVLFIGVAMAITAFPVLARILIELDLLQTDIGLSVLAAGVGNDIVGWCLLALAVALVNAGQSITILYIILTSFGWILMLIFIVRPVFIWFAKKTGSFETAPSHGTMVITMLLVLISSWITQVIGIHAIFGAFLVGVILPHGKFASSLTEKLEDMVSTLFLPLYFALSGLKTDLSLLNDGSIWGWTVCVVVVAFVSKFFGCAVVAKFFGYTWRESGAIGSLMSCKGLVELIVLNIGLSAGILNSRVFAIFVVMALVTTFATTPLTLAFYPMHYRLEIQKLRYGQSPSSTKPSHSTPPSSPPFDDSDEKQSSTPEEVKNLKDTFRIRSRILIALNVFEHLPTIMAFIKLVQQDSSFAAGREIDHDDIDTHKEQKDDHIDEEQDDGDDDGDQNKEAHRYSLAKVTTGTATVAAPSSSATRVSIDALRLIELTERTSTLMRASDWDSSSKRDTLTNIFKTFVTLNGIPVRNHFSVVPWSELSNSLATHATKCHSDLLIIPWNTGPATQFEDPTTPGGGYFLGGFESLMRGTTGFSPADRYAQYANFVKDAFNLSPVDVGLYLDHGSSSVTFTAGSRKHIFLPFCGGPDDRLALQLTVQMCMNPAVSATVIRIISDADTIQRSTGGGGGEGITPVTPSHQRQNSNPENTPHTPHTPGIHSLHRTDTLQGPLSPGFQAASDTADYTALYYYFGNLVNHEPNGELSQAAGLSIQDDNVQLAMDRIKFGNITTSTPLQTIVNHAQSLSSNEPAPLLVVSGRSRIPSVVSFKDELTSLINEKASIPPTPSTSHHQTHHHTDKLGIASSIDVRKTLGNVASAMVVTSLNASLLIVQSSQHDTKSSPNTV